MEQGIVLTITAGILAVLAVVVVTTGVEMQRRYRYVLRVVEKDKARRKAIADDLRRRYD